MTNRAPSYPSSIIVTTALAVAASAVLLPGVADARSSRARGKRPDMIKTDKPVARGTHWRITSDNGPIHIWIPPGYDRDTAGTVIYIHGYYVTADTAWRDHKLPQQFYKSRQNAMFIVPEAPKGNDDRVYWTSLVELKKTVRRAGMRMPDGPTIVMAHSGGFRTVSSWVDNRLLAQVILLDALYGGQKEFDAFIDSGKRAQHHKMVIVASDTVSKSRAFADKFRYAVVKDKIPKSFTDFSKRERGTKLLYIRSQYGHGTIVDGGTVMPLILRLTPLARL